ncbi:MAG: enoyl-CoA hydratase/isomerase family protein [Gammaproteobacteria bacterium]|nr:enoyl-CoA hydratase/isomerase family protein [Gammaproteobacteria bacterium]
MTGPAVRVRDERGIGVVEIDHPPVNALARPVRAALLEAIERLAEDPAVRAIVIHGCGRHFIAGADVREFDAPPAPPLLHELLNRLEALDKPVIAALHGTTLGGGAELALASHYRCATPDLSLGFPEIKLGLLPGAGGTVRLPRLVGIRRALELMTSGTPIGIAAARELGLVDHELRGDVLAGALAFARERVAAGTPPRRTTDLPMPVPESPAVFDEARTALSAAARRVPASEAIIAAVEAAAARPWREALAVARERFDACRRSTESRALRHLFFAERVPAPGGAPQPVATVGIVGAGTMGSGIAIAAATAGLEVTLVDTQAAALAAGLERIARHFTDVHRKGRLDAAAAAAAGARVRGAATLAALAPVDLVIEAVFESLEVKRAVFAELGRTCRPGAVLATNTSTLDVDAIAAASDRPADVVGMHFFSPAHVMRLLEIVRGRDTTPAVLATAFALGKRLGKIGVVVGNGFGFVGNRMLYAYGREKELMMLEGASPTEIDRALEAFGMAMGPNAVGDLAGLDVGYAVRRAWTDRPDDPRFYRVSDLLVEHGRLGQKNGRGFYRYEPGARRGTSDPEVEALIRAEAERLGIARRAIGAEEIVERCTLALIGEGIRLLEEGIAARASDVDLVWCHGYGFPRERGGPMFHADTLGLAHVLDRIRHYASACGPRYWTPAASLEQLAARGARLADEASTGAT